MIPVIVLIEHLGPADTAAPGQVPTHHYWINLAEPSPSTALQSLTHQLSHSSQENFWHSPLLLLEIKVVGTISSVPHCAYFLTVPPAVGA